MLHILGMGACHPDTVVDNKFLEDLDVGTNAQWIEEKIGVITRVTTLTLDYIKTTRNEDPRMAVDVASMSPEDMGVKAAEIALKKAGITAQQVGMIIVNCCTPRQTVPSEAARIAERLDCPGVAFDVFISIFCATTRKVNFLNLFSASQLLL